MSNKVRGDRNIKIYQLREKGLSFAQIGRIYNITRERARQIDYKIRMILGQKKISTEIEKK